MATAINTLLESVEQELNSKGIKFTKDKAFKKSFGVVILELDGDIKIGLSKKKCTMSRNGKLVYNFKCQGDSPEFIEIASNTQSLMKVAERFVVSETAQNIRTQLKAICDGDSTLYYSDVEAGEGVIDIDEDGEKIYGSWGNGGHVERRTGGQRFSITEKDGRINIDLANDGGSYWEKDYELNEIHDAISYCMNNFRKY